MVLIFGLDMKKAVTTFENVHGAGGQVLISFDFAAVVDDSAIIYNRILVLKWQINPNTLESMIIDKTSMSHRQ
jgi:hypothetical protein